MKNHFEHSLLKKLTVKEKKVLNYLLNDARIKDSEISEKLKISIQGARKIRKKLESTLIKDYITDIDYSLIGFKMFAIIIFHPLKTLEEVMPIMQPHLISLYRIHRSFITYVSFLAFRDILDLEELFHKMRSEYRDLIEIKQTKLFSVNGLIKNSDFSLIHKHLFCFGKENKILPKKIESFRYNQYEKNNANKEIKLNENEKNFLNQIHKNSRVSFVDLAKQLNISPTAADKIRNRMEKKGITKKYSIKIDYSKLGINLFAFVSLREKNIGDSFNSWALEEPNLTGCYKLIDGSLLLLFAFRDLEELERYLSLLQAKNKDLVEIEDVNVFTNKGIIQNVPTFVL